MDASGTEALRSSATHWTLAGDKQLLQLLQDIHEKVVTRCQETNSLLEQMATSLNEANIDVQSVNNKLMTLSNSQFVESRVYGDDADLTTDPVPQKEEPKPPDSPLNKTIQSLHVLDSLHDSFEIYDDTDSDSDSDNCISSTVLKPKDVYSHRPLPYIIGSYNWRTKWHVGLIHQSSDSDEDSNAERPSQKNEYSDTESVKEETRERSRTLSSSSSERRSVPVPPKMPEAPVMSPVDIASELARRLGNVPQMPSVSQDLEPPKMSTGKIYRPEQPTAATIFPDEPPPLDQTVSDGEFEEEEDIFAELHRNGQKGTAREEQRQSTPPPLSKQVSNLFDGDSESELFAPKPQVRFAAEQSKPVVSDNIVKKPVGGISLFGKNSFGESIEAAIIRRHRRKSSSSDDNTDNDEHPNQETKTETIKNESVVKTKEKDFINVLFPKPRSRDEIQKDKPKASLTVVKIEEKKVDLFNDNLFDDIDDIFSSNIVKTTPTNNAQKPKPLFDDDDDLFAEVSVSQPVKVLYKNDDKIKKKSLFDSDDELFSEIPEKPINKVISSKNPVATNSNTSKVKETKVKSIFDDSSDDDDNIFNKIVTSKPIRETTIVSDHTLKSKDSYENAIKSDNNFNAVSKTKDENVFSSVDEQIKITTTDIVNNNLNNSSDGYITQHQVTKIKTNNEIRRKHVTFQSPSLFDDDNDDSGDLFSKENSNDTKSNDALSVRKGDNNMEIESPTVSSDVKNTNRVLAEETPFKKSKGESKRIVDVDDSLLEDEFEQEFDDYDNNEPSQSNEKDKSDDIKSSDDTKQKSEQISETSNKVDEKAEDDLDFSRSTESTPPPVQKSIKVQLPTTKKNIINIEKTDAFDDNIKAKEMSSVATPFTEEPPAFEKPKESKKSKNINALFDDDSDDEALFFKKSDAPLVDEKPELFSAVDSSKNMFGVFLDEPPDVNVDFTQKDDKTKRKTDDKQETLPVETKEDDILDKPPSKPDQTEQNIGNSVDKIVSKTKDNKKPIGKLKMNLNINVNTLLPGASPKKTVKIKEHEETEHSTNTLTEELDGKVPPKEDERTTDKEGDVMTRSASFESDPEANVLDNKLSKQRPRIQVKRRPSTRRARHEAVRKSVIDLTDDTTDNSGSIDDNSAPISKDVTATDVSKANDDEKVDYIQNESIDATENKTDEIIKDSKQFVDSIEVTERKDVKSKVVYILNDEDIFTNTNDDVKDTVNSIINNALDQFNPTSDSVDKSSDDLAKSDEKDEDILKDLLEDHVNTESNPIEEQIEEEKPISNIVNEIFDELFKSSKKIDAQPKPILKHSESVKNETQKPKIFLFDDLSEDEDLFKPNTSNASKPKNIFGSDTDDDIFVSKKKETETKPLDVEKGEKVEVKRSLFSDDDDDDDLFRAKKSSVEKKASVKSTTSKGSQQLAVKDPLAMLDDVYENAKRSFK